MLNHSTIKIAVLPGDGIGREVIDAVLPIFSALALPITYHIGDIGWECWVNQANPIPEKTWDLINQSDTILLGATTSKPEREAKAELLDKSNLNVVYISPIIQLRQKLDLFANVRPCFSINKHKEFNFCVIRENTEGLYSGFDYDYLPDEFKKIISKVPHWNDKVNEALSCTLRINSETGLRRIIKFAFEYALKNNHSRVSYADKPNVLRKSSTLGRAVFEEIAAQYPHIKADILNVDAVGMHLVTKPEMFGVIVTENMFGDILSDVAAGVMGGLGLAPSANIGLQKSYFEPVHGSGPKMQKNTANPSATFFSLSMLLSYFGHEKFAHIIKNAVINIIRENKTVTRDLGGSSSTHEMAHAIIEEAKIGAEKNA
jgi:isocitrate/isopropylmalate dehydrogenase